MTTNGSGEKEKHDAEATIKRNPHPDFAKVQASRPDWDEKNSFHFTKTKSPEWQYGSGANDKSRDSKKHICIDPNDESRPPAFNYKLMISGVIPRPIGFLSTRSKDGSSTNLAPFSYTQMYNHDPPIFCIGFSGGLDNAKDSLTNLSESKECVINFISEHFIEAANACAIDLPYGQSEWAVTGLTPAECETVQCARVKESIFSVEGKLMNLVEHESRRTPGKKTGVIATIEGTRFWVREDALNKDQNLIDPTVYNPIARLGGITYARLTDAFEIPRPILKNEREKGKIQDSHLKAKVDGQ